MLPMVGLAAAPEMIPGISVARGLQVVAGAGFLLYCLVFFGLLIARLRLRARSSASRARDADTTDVATADRP
ncbi:hypothetical protein [Streptomyces sp. NPDC018031]|uniref:hypothetical protein n=1 Tax=Streptomyces sp. NPDC018031 TaxID=3365033 RepID=UPI0037BE0769